MSRSHLRFAAPVLGLLLLAGCAANRTPRAAGPPDVAAGPGERTAILLHVNDVYRIEGVEAGTIGGIARLRTLREELEREHPDLLVFHGGDLLFPSFLSRTFNGEQMIDVLNALDGDPNAFDDRMFAVFGNHEFEKDKKKDAPLLDQRVEQSQFRWVNGNVVFANGEDGQPLIAGENLAQAWLSESGRIRIGIFGVTVDSKKPEYASRFLDPVERARELTAELRRQGAEVVVGLTHLNAADDRRLLASLGEAGPDLILGGHDHEHMACDVGGRFVLKADADARTATVARLTLAADGRLTVRSELRKLGPEDPRPDPGVQTRAQGWLERHEKLFCEKAGAQPGCLEQVVGRSKARLEAEETKIRGSETNFGDWIADRMVETFASCGAQAAFINSGSLRLNQDLPAGEITRRHIEELFAYPTPLYLLRLKGSELQAVAEHAAAGWPGAGNWLQVSGFSFVHDTQARKVSDVRLVTSAGRRPVRPDEEVLVVTNQYLFDESGDRDGYELTKDMVVEGCAANGKDLKTDVVVPALQAASGGIDPRTDGRIRQVPEQAAADPCAEAP